MQHPILGSTRVGAPKRRSWFRNLASALALPLVLVLVLTAAPGQSLAASGGRIGGGSFRSAPSMPRNYGGGGGYRGGYGGGYGGGIGFPFLIPLFGFGGGGLFGFLILMAVVGVIANALRGGGGGGQALPAGLRGGDLVYGPPADGPVTIAQLQVGLLASARELQGDLRRLAASADTGSSSGLQQVLQDTTLALLRHPDLWVYAGSEEGEVPFASAESTFNRLSMGERSKLERELTTNVAGTRRNDTAIAAGDSDATSDFIAITLLVASRRRLRLPQAGSSDQLRQSLQQLGAIAADDLLALEVIWQPDGAGEVLSTAELLTAYPQLQHL